MMVQYELKTRMVDFFYFQKDVSINFLEEMDFQSSGCREDNEYIRIRVKKMAEVSNQLTSSSALIGIKLLEIALNRTF